MVYNIVILLFIFLVYQKIFRNIRSKINGVSIALLLCTVNIEERKSMYEDIILWWLDHSSFDIFIVDSTTNPFHNRIETQCHICRFDQKSLFSDKLPNSTILETHALRTASRYFKNEWSYYTYVVKLTGKYKIPMLQRSLQSFITNSSVELFVQSLHHKGFQNTELYIIKTSLFKYMLLLIDLYDDKQLMEHKFNRMLEQNDFIYQRLHTLKNEANYKRGDGSRLSHV